MEREFIAQTLYAWGRGKDKAKALRNLRLYADRETLKKQGYTIWDCPKGTTVCEVRGTLSYPASADEPVLVDDKRTEYAKGGRA